VPGCQPEGRRVVRGGEAASGGNRLSSKPLIMNGKGGGGGGLVRIVGVGGGKGEKQGWGRAVCFFLGLGGAQRGEGGGEFFF
jgi:hypothetical protein